MSEPTSAQLPFTEGHDSVPPEPTRRHRWRQDRRPPVLMLVSCAVVWCLLWGQFSIANAVGGFVLGVLVWLVFPLPRLALRGRIRPLGLLQLLGKLAVELVTSSVHVLYLVLRPGPPPRSVILAVHLRSRSDLYLTLTCELVSLIPGSLVLEARRNTGTVYIHVLGVDSPKGIAAARRSVLDAEEMVIRAFGHRNEVAALRRNQPVPTWEEIP